MKKRYINKANNYEVDDGMKFCGLWAFLFGPIYFAVRGNWSWFFISIFFAVCSFGLSLFIVPFFARSINRKHLLMRGFEEIKE